MLLLSQFSGLHQLLQLQSRNYAGYIPRLINIGKRILHIVQAADGSEIAGHRYELHIRILCGSLHHKGLMAVAVGNHQITAGSYQVHSRLIAFLLLGNIVFPDDVLVLRQSQIGNRLLNALNVRRRIGLRVISQKDHSHFDIAVGLSLRAAVGAGSRTALAAASEQSQSHKACQGKTEYFLFHRKPPSLYIGDCKSI